MARSEPIRVLVVDDAVVVRQLIRHALEDDSRIQVVGTAANSRIVLDQIDRLRPQVVLFDLELAQADDEDLLGDIRAQHPEIRLVTFSRLPLVISRDPAATAGAIEHLRSQLMPRIMGTSGHEPQPRSSRVARPLVVAIGVSTGGPQALAVMLPQLPEHFPLPVLVVQHMPPNFTKMLAATLNRDCRMQVLEAENGAELHAGVIYIAPGGRHLRVEQQYGVLRAVIDDGPPENSCRPSVDVLFRSLASACEGRVLAVILTGMGHDGLAGAKLLKESGCRVLAQDEASSVVWGMPGSVVEAGVADEVVPLGAMAGEVRRLTAS